MGTEESTVLPSTTNVSPSTTVLLSKFNVAALRRDFERLSVDDLTALASFPVEPHELIGRVVAVTHCLLLSLAPEHTTLELCPPPWPILRLQLLDDTPHIWRKLRKRASQLENRVKSLSPVQVRFGCTELVPFILPPKHENSRNHGAWQLDRLGKVSTIAASLGAWAVFCLCCSVLPPLSINLRSEAPAAPSSHNADTFQSLSLVRYRSPRKHGSNRNTSHSSVKNSAVSGLVPITPQKHFVRSSRRIGVKVGGRFMLFHTRFPRNFRLDVKSVESLGEWSVYCLDANRIGQQQNVQGLGQSSDAFPFSLSWWKPPREIETQLPKTPHSLALCQLTQFTQLSLLLQLGFHEHLFERPVQSIPYVKTPRVTSPVFTLKFDVVATDSLHQLSPMGIGNALITMETTVDELRSQLTPSIVASLFSVDEKRSNFRFMYRGSFLAVSQERHVPAVSLLPFALLIVSRNYSVKGYHAGNCASQLWQHHNGVSQALVNCGLPELLQETKSMLVSGSPLSFVPSATQTFAIRQPLMSTTACSSPASMTSVIVEFFTHWTAFVSFQQLQDSLVLFQLPQISPEKQTKFPQKSPQHGLNNENEDVRNESIPYDARNESVPYDARSESVPYGPHPQPLPRKKFNSKKEWLLPLYAVVEITSSTSAVLKTPFRQDVEHALASPCRLVLAEESNVIHLTRINHVTMVSDGLGVQIAVFDVTFVRDESCSLESLVKLQGVYGWIIVSRKTRKTRDEPAQPTEWMIDLYRFVQHPTYDFQTLSYQPIIYFRVRIPWQIAERAIETAFWSKNVDWTPSISSTDLYTTVLREIFEMLCRSHPPASGVDSVKFSKLLYEAKIQPTLLGIGDAAFLFASNLTPGSSEMDFGGFVRAIEWISQQFFSDHGVKVKGSSRKVIPGIQHAMKKWQLSQSDACDRLLAPLQRFCYEILVHLPSLTSTWHDIMDPWRRGRKQQLLGEYARKYCAATRLRACWIGFVAWRIFLKQRQRMKEERLAATKLQSLFRRRKQYLEYHRVRRIIVRTQLRIHARSELRRLRAERTAFVKRMRVRTVKWVRHHLWLLGLWKRLNAVKVARRDRIREKRLRRVGVAVFPLDTLCVCFTLYRAKSVIPTEESISVSNSEIRSASTEQQGEPIEMYDLEVVDPTRSWGHVISVSQHQIEQFIVEEAERLSLQLQLGLTTLTEPHKKLVPISSPSSPPPIQNSNLPQGRKQVKVFVTRDSVVHPLLEPNIMLLALARRLVILKDPQHDPVSLRCYKHPADTSLGKLVFKGALRSELDQSHGILVQRHIVRVLEWAGTFKFLMYTPATSDIRRYDLDAAFIFSVLQFSRFQSMRLAIPDEEDDVVTADQEETDRASASESAMAGNPHQIQRVLNGPHQLIAFQGILSYVLKYGVCTPTYAMMSHVVAEKERQRQNRESEQRNGKLAREKQLIVMVQTCLRQHLARKTRQQLALSCYLKKFDNESRRFVYVQQYQSGICTVLGERKPFSLFDKDVPLPPDEWQPTSASDNSICFFNPRRGVSSRYNTILAATAIQRWFRGKMWNGVNNWKLRDTVRALRYQNNVHKPTKMTDLGELENIKRYALHLHALQHQYKEAYSMYEAALKLSPDDPQTLVCLATLLVISCRYPAAQSWKRGMALLQQARMLVGDDMANILQEVEQNAFRWALFLQPKNPHAIANYAVYLQCVYLDIDKAELLYRRALDLDSTNDLFITNFQRLLSERAPGGMYAFAGPGKIALARSSEVCRFGLESQWREMEDPAAQPPIPTRFFQDRRTGKCTWDLPAEDSELNTVGT